MVIGFIDTWLYKVIYKNNVHATNSFKFRLSFSITAAYSKTAKSGQFTPQHHPSK
jgi:hypothetical protein